MRMRSGRIALWLLIVSTAISGLPLHLVETAAHHVCGDECSCGSFVEASCCARPEPEPEPSSCCAREDGPDERAPRPVLVDACSCHDPAQGGLVLDGPPRLTPQTIAGLPRPTVRGALEGPSGARPISRRPGPEPPPRAC